MGQENWPNLRRLVMGKRPLKPWAGVLGAGTFSSSVVDDTSPEPSEPADEDQDSQT